MSVWINTKDGERVTLGAWAKQQKAKQQKVKQVKVKQRELTPLLPDTPIWSVLYKGNFQDKLKESALKVDVICYILDDPEKTPVVSQRGLDLLLGFTGDRGGQLARFLSGKKISSMGCAKLKEKLGKPYRYQLSKSTQRRGRGTPPYWLRHYHHQSNL